MLISVNEGTPKSSILMVFSLINHPAIGVSPFIEPPPCHAAVEVIEEVYGKLKESGFEARQAGSKVVHWQLLWPELAR